MRPKVKLQDQLCCAHAMWKGLKVDEIYGYVLFAACPCWQQRAGEEAATGDVKLVVQGWWVMLRAAGILALRWLRVKRAV